MILTKSQIKKIKSVDVGGRGGKDLIIAEALGHERVSTKFYDAVTKTGETVEYKKQQGSQFLDPYKFSQMSDEEKKIKILFFVHDGSRIKEIYQTDYSNLIDKMGYSDEDLKAIKDLYSRDCFVNRPNTQIKAELKLQEIKTFEKIL